MDVGVTIDEAEFRKPLARGCAMKKEVTSVLETREVGEGRGSLDLTQRQQVSILQGTNEKFKNV